jgi:hypothetical protein
MERRPKGGLVTRSLNTFGVWLCERAAAYQNTYSIAAELTAAAQKTSVRFAAREFLIQSLLTQSLLTRHTPHHTPHRNLLHARFASSVKGSIGSRVMGPLSHLP